MRYSIRLSYDGAPFSGWQIQPQSPTVQQCLQDALGTLLKAETSVTGAGRTDTGVNAVNYAAHFDAPEGLDTADLSYKLNAILPPAVTIHEIRPEDAGFHARFDAVRRTYTYFIHRKKDPFAARFSYLCAWPGLDFDKMNEAAASLLGTHDFSCFEKTGGNNKTSVCTVFEAYWAPYVPDHCAVAGYPEGNGREWWYFRISADRFLRNMVRAVVGTLIEVGRGRRDPSSVAELIGSGTRSDAGESVPGHALFLTGVEY